MAVFRQSFSKVFGPNLLARGTLNDVNYTPGFILRDRATFADRYPITSLALIAFIVRHYLGRPTDVFAVHRMLDQSLNRY
jgi:hypothetical protein